MTTYKTVAQQVESFQKFVNYWHQEHNKIEASAEELAEALNSYTYSKPLNAKGK